MSKKRMFQEIKDLAKRIRDLSNVAAVEYGAVVENIIRSGCRDANEIEHTLDGLFDFCFDAKVLLLYKKLCRYYYDIDPVATAHYVSAYREYWDTPPQKRSKISHSKSA